MPHLYVALHSGIHSDSSMPRLSKNPRSQGVDPSPTPMMPTVGDSSTEISTPFLISDCANIMAAIQPAEPPPTMTIFLICGGRGRLLTVGLNEKLNPPMLVVPHCGGTVVWSGLVMARRLSNDVAMLASAGRAG